MNKIECLRYETRSSKKHLFTFIIIRHITTKMNVSLRKYPKEHLPEEKHGGLRRGIKKRLCVQCKSSESLFFCIGCSQYVLGTMVHICNPKRDGGRNCWEKLHDFRACITNDRQNWQKSENYSLLSSRIKERPKEKRWAWILLLIHDLEATLFLKLPMVYKGQQFIFRILQNQKVILSIIWFSFTWKFS